MAAIRINADGYLAIDFRWNCRRHVLSTGLTDTKPNRQIVSLKAKAIQYDIKNNNLDIARYFPRAVITNSKESKIVTLSDFFNYYLKEKNLRSTSMRQLLYAWDKHINPHFGNHKLTDINRHEILVFRNLVSESMAGSSTNLIMVHLAGILTRAHDEGRIPIYPMKKIGKLETGTPPVDPFSFEELAHLLKFLYDKDAPEADMIFIWSRCGFRHGEILGLKWDDVDYYRSQISVNRTLLNDGSEGAPKTRGSVRTLTLRPDVITALKRQEKRSRMACDYIFPSPVTRQRYKMPVDFWRRFKNILKLAGLKYRSPNQLRHTFATLHIAAGENITWVSKMMGHRNVTTTLERYNKFIPNLTRDDGSAFENAFDKIMKPEPLPLVLGEKEP